MSRLWQAVLENIRTIGNNSGCHQMPDRSFFYEGKQFPVCARCTGVFIGHITAVIFGVCRVSINSMLAIMCLSVMGLDWGIQAFGFKDSTNKRRLITGFFGGLGLFTVYINVIKYVVKKLSCLLR